MPTNPTTAQFTVGYAATARMVAARRVKAAALVAAWLKYAETTADETDPAAALELAYGATDADWRRIEALAGTRPASSHTRCIVFNDLQGIAAGDLPIPCSEFTPANDAAVARGRALLAGM